MTTPPEMPSDTINFKVIDGLKIKIYTDSRLLPLLSAGTSG